MNDFIILSIATHLAASKNKNYQENTYLYYGALVDFLQSYGLTSRELLGKDGTIPNDFKLMKSDLTAEGFELIKKALDKWMAAVSSGKKGPTDVSILEKALKKHMEG